MGCGTHRGGGRVNTPDDHTLTDIARRTPLGQNVFRAEHEAGQTLAAQAFCDVLIHFEGLPETEVRKIARAAGYPWADEVTA